MTSAARPAEPTGEAAERGADGLVDEASGEAGASRADHVVRSLLGCHVPHWCIVGLEKVPSTELTTCAVADNPPHRRANGVVDEVGQPMSSPPSDAHLKMRPWFWIGARHLFRAELHSAALPSLVPLSV
jgi:hypothetical protein